MRPMPAGAVAAKNSAPRYATGEPDMPKHLGKPARAVWKRTVSQMSAAGTLAVVDRDILAAYCVAVASLEELSAQINREGQMVTVQLLDRNNRPTGATVCKPHPGLKWRADLMNKVRQLAGELGITPAARSKAGAAIEAPGQQPNKVRELKERIAAIRRGENPEPSGNKLFDIMARFQAAE